MKKAALLVAYGPSTPQGRMALGCFEQACRLRFPSWTLRWAFTSDASRQRLARQRQKSDSVRKALLRLQYEGFRGIAVQPLHTIAGREHEAVRYAVDALNGVRSLRCALGLPLLHGGQDLAMVARALLKQLPPERVAGENVIFMGHGARHQGAAIYGHLAEAVYSLDADVHVGTMYAVCSLEQVLERLRPGPVWLMPLLATVGQHALRDMAGPEPTSWYSRITGAGHECRPLLAGIAEGEPLRELWLRNLSRAMQVIDS